MSGYTLDHIIDECVREKSKNVAPNSKEGIYVEAWSALNTWLDALLTKKRGGNINLLGAFTWEIKTDADGSRNMRPLFLMNDQFVKDFTIKRPRIFYAPETVKNEEINFSKLAIKFTNNLTKDMVFSAVRDIIRKLGDFIRRGYVVSLPFTFGVLRAKERRVSFEFSYSKFGGDMALTDGDILNSARSDTGLEEIEAILAGAMANKREKEDDGIAETAPEAAPESDMPTVPKLALPPQPDVRTSIPFDSDRPDDLDLAPSSSSSSSHVFFDSSGPDGETTPTIIDLLDSVGPVSPKTKLERQKEARQRVAQQAFLRCLGNLEETAVMEKVTQDVAQAQFDEWEKTEIKKRQEVHSKGKDLRESLDVQIHRYEANKKKEKERRQAGVINYKLPGALPDELLPMPPRSKAEKHKEQHRTLTYQMKSKETAVTAEKERQLQEEKEYLDLVSMELDMEAAVDRVKHLKQQQTLLESWERDGHLRNLRKLQEAGSTSLMNKYITSNLEREHLEESHAPSTFSKAVGVGYDTRKGMTQTL
jgi:hypothetical protein